MVRYPLMNALCRCLPRGIAKFEIGSFVRIAQSAQAQEISRFYKHGSSVLGGKAYKRDVPVQ